MSNSLLFAQTCNEYIVAVSVNPKVNYMLNEKQELELGLAGFIKSVEKDKHFILFDSLTNRVISMTNTAHKRLFSAIDNFHKINLPSFFPFVSKI